MTNSLLAQAQRNREARRNAPRPTNWETKYDALENAIFNVNEAMDALRGIHEYQDWLDTLGDMLGEMKNEMEPLEARAGAEYDREIEALTREYYRSVI